MSEPDPKATASRKKTAKKKTAKKKAAAPAASAKKKSNGAAKAGAKTPVRKAAAKKKTAKKPAAAAAPSTARGGLGDVDERPAATPGAASPGAGKTKKKKAAKKASKASKATDANGAAGSGAKSAAARRSATPAEASAAHDGAALPARRARGGRATDPDEPSGGDPRAVEGAERSDEADLVGTESGDDLDAAGDDDPSLSDDDLLLGDDDDDAAFDLDGDDSEEDEPLPAGDAWEAPKTVRGAISADDEDDDEGDEGDDEPGVDADADGDDDDGDADEDAPPRKHAVLANEAAATTRADGDEPAGARPVRPGRRRRPNTVLLPEEAAAKLMTKPNVVNALNWIRVAEGTPRDVLLALQRKLETHVWLKESDENTKIDLQRALDEADRLLETMPDDG